MTGPLPLSPRMSYGQMRMALYTVAPDLHVASARLPGKLDGLYCLATNTVLIDRRITYTRKRCALVHELVHWRHGDDTTHGCLGGKNERRCRRETAMLLINSAEYALAERMYDGNPLPDGRRTQRDRTSHRRLQELAARQCGRLEERREP